MIKFEIIENEIRVKLTNWRTVVSVTQLCVLCFGGDMKNHFKFSVLNKLAFFKISITKSSGGRYHKVTTRFVYPKRDDKIET